MIERRVGLGTVAGSYKIGSLRIFKVGRMLVINIEKKNENKLGKYVLKWHKFNFSQKKSIYTKNAI